MKERKIPVLFASNYFDRNQIQQVAEKTGATAVIVPGEHPRRPGRRDLLRSDERLGQRPRGRVPRGGLLMLDQLIHSLWLAPLVACMVIVAIHSYLGLHVLAREVIFVDLSLAQVAALGSTVAIFVGAESGFRDVLRLRASGSPPPAPRFSPLTRSEHGKGRVPQEAIIGIVYVVASAAGHPGRRRVTAGRGGHQGHPGGKPALGGLARDRPTGGGVRVVGAVPLGSQTEVPDHFVRAGAGRRRTAGNSAGGISGSISASAS